MRENEHKAAVAALLGVSAEQVIQTKQYGEEVVALVDYGIGGIKKYTLSLAAIEATANPAPEAVAIEPEPAAIDAEETPAAPAKPKPRKGK